MYHAKETGAPNYQFFTEQMNLAATRRVQLENDLRSSLQNQELRMFYQPVVEIATGRITGYEGLLRWQHHSRGLISPGEFIQLAEDTGLILRIGDWVLGAVCRWGALSTLAKDLSVGVNLSARQFADPKLVDIVARALQDSKLPPARLELEVSESTAMQHSEPAMQTLRRLRDLGVKLVIDDFGTSYSSLVNLKRYPIDKLKIDKSLIASIPADADSADIVVAVVDLAHALGLEGRRGRGARPRRRKKCCATPGCDLMQGFRPGAPMDPGGEGLIFPASAPQRKRGRSRRRARSRRQSRPARSRTPRCGSSALERQRRRAFVIRRAPARAPSAARARSPQAAAATRPGSRAPG
jgi:EAL domain-containing protein (putative c-di-GMP-specific phosphodiesterase class I)